MIMPKSKKPAPARSLSGLRPKVLEMGRRRAPPGEERPPPTAEEMGRELAATVRSLYPDELAVVRAVCDRVPPWPTEALKNAWAVSFSSLATAKDEEDVHAVQMAFRVIKFELARRLRNQQDPS